MRTFLIKIIICGIALWGLNMVIGKYLQTYETVDLQQKQQFYPPLRWTDYYKVENNIDILILGSSHAFRAFDPRVLETELNRTHNVFNLGSSAQTPVTSFYILQEVLQKHQPKLLIFDIYFMVYTSDNQLRNGRFNWQNMEAGIAKNTFFKNGFSLQEQVSLKLFPSYTYKAYFKNKFNKLLGRRYRPRPKGAYQGKGFVSKKDSVEITKLKFQNQFDAFEVSEEDLTLRNLEYLEKIKDLCSEKNIQLIFTTTPMPQITVDKVKNHDRFSEVFQNLSNEWEIPYYDFNTDRLSSLVDTLHFYDDDHLNAAGAILFSQDISNKIRPFLQ